MKRPKRLRLSKHRHLKINSDPIDIEDALIAIRMEKDLIIMPECIPRLVTHLLEKDNLKEEILYLAIREGSILNFINKMENKCL